MKNQLISIKYHVKETIFESLGVVLLSILFREKEEERGRERKKNVIKAKSISK